MGFFIKYLLVQASNRQGFVTLGQLKNLRVLVRDFERFFKEKAVLHFINSLGGFCVFVDLD